MTYIYLLELPPQRLFNSDACSIFQDTSAVLIWPAALIWSFMAAIHFFVCSQYVFMCDTIECDWLIQLVQSLTAKQEVLHSIPSLVKG